MNRKPVLGLIGGVGAGKSTAAQCFATFGGCVISADEIAHGVLNAGAVRDLLRNAFGPSIFAADGSIDRKSLGKRVFADRSERSKLEAVVLPHIGAEMRRRVELFESRDDCRFIVLDAPTLLEAGWGPACDRIAFVDAPEAVRLKRVSSRGWSAEDWTAREAAQLGLDEKRSRAHAVISNAPGFPELTQQVAGLLEKWNWIAPRANEPSPAPV